MGQGARRIGYARVSTEDQNLSLQLDALNAAGCSRVFCDQGISGMTLTRPALDDALATLNDGDTLVVWRLDRLGRSLSHLIDIIKELGSRGVGICSLSESIDTTTAAGKLVFHLLCALCEFERDLLSERTRAGMASAKARGATLGRPPKLTPMQILQARIALAACQMDREELAASFGVSPLTLERALKRLEPTS